jgi:fluoroquinolone resistance protein
VREYCGETFSKLDRAGEGLSSLLFEDCLFTGCRLEGALVENCQFSGCRFEGCKITAPKFRATQMLSCDFADCALSGVDWSALLDERKRGMGFLPFDSLRGCSLRHCVFFGLDLKGFQFAGADLSGSFFDGCKLEEASFAGCRLQGTSFAQNDLRGADFRGATEYFFSLEGNRVKNAKFSLPEAVNLLAALGVVIEDL